jgi:hypothetical protein
MRTKRFGVHTVSACHQCTTRHTIHLLRFPRHGSLCFTCARSYWMHFHKQVLGPLQQTTRLTSRPERHPGSELSCRGGSTSLDSSLSTVALFPHRFSIQSRVVRTIRHWATGSTARMKCLYHSPCGNTHQCTSLTTIFELRSGEVQTRAFLMEMHPLSLQLSSRFIHAVETD